MIIREAAIEDFGGADAVQKAAGLPPNHPYCYAKNLGRNGAVNLVAEDGTKIVGFISILADPRNPNGEFLWQRLRSYVAFLGVLPTFRNRGIGSDLMRKGASMVLNDERPTLWLECEKERIVFYELLGFNVVSSEFIQGTYGLPPGACVLRLEYDN